jgi:hypothetical protein
VNRSAVGVLALVVGSLAACASESGRPVAGSRSSTGTAAATATATPGTAVSAEFWAWIDLLGGVPTERGANRLTAALRAAGPAAVDEFERNLDLAMAAMDTPAHLAVRVTDIDSGYLDLPLGGDLWEYVRLSVITAGPAEWRRVVDDPPALGEPRYAFDGEYLALVVPAAQR